MSLKYRPIMYLILKCRKKFSTIETSLVEDTWMSSNFLEWKGYFIEDSFSN